jgi:threonine dehydratase
MSETKYFPSIEAIDHAATVLSQILEPTPFQRNSNLSDTYGADVYLKREDLQMVRSY